MKIVSVVSKLPSFDSLGVNEVLHFAAAACNPLFAQNPEAGPERIKTLIQDTFGPHLDVELVDLQGNPCDHLLENRLILKIVETDHKVLQ